MLISEISSDKVWKTDYEYSKAWSMWILKDFKNYILHAINWSLILSENFPRSYNQLLICSCSSWWFYHVTFWIVL